MKKTGWDETERRVGRALLRCGLGVAAIASAAWLAAPLVLRGGLVCGPINADESSAIATLKNLHSAETMFRDSGQIDRDGDGIGEFGWFEELAGAAALRGSTHARRLGEPFLSRAFGEVSDGCVARAGYHFQLWLPAAGGGWTHSGTGIAVDRERAEREFCAYAWPALSGAGKRAFWVTAAGDVYACRNEPGYLGTIAPVPVDAALPTSRADGAQGDWGHTGRDGGEWVIVQ